MYYKYCIVPQCTSTTVTTPEKVFLSVPRKPEIRKKWLIHMRRNPRDLVPCSRRNICEDHFNMENDIDNYMEYKMGFCSKMYLKKGVVPSKFDCQPDRKGRLLDSDFHRTAYTKRRRAEFFKEIVQQTKAVDTEEPDTKIEENMTKTSIERDELEDIKPVKIEILEVADSGPSCSFTLDKSQFAENLKPKKSGTDLEVKEEDEDSTTFKEFEEYLEPLENKVLEVKTEVEDLDYAGSPPKWESRISSFQRRRTLDVDELWKRRGGELDRPGPESRSWLETEMTAANILVSHLRANELSNSAELVDPLALSEDRRFCCHHCGFRSALFNILKEHILSREGDDCPASCPDCTFNFAKPSSLRAHIRIFHEDSRVFFCSNCDYRCTDSSNLRRHIQVLHEGKRPYSCRQCDYTCARSSDLKQHIQVRHECKRPYSCPQCDYTCAWSSDLKRHIHNLHEGKRPYSCPQCDFTCAQSSKLKRHIKIRHEGKRPYSCPQCDYSCAQSSKLKRHIQILHEGRRPYSCPQCDYTCARSSDLKRHIEARHEGIRPFSCPQCEYACTRSSHLKRHIQARH